MKESVDVVVIGAGIAGASTACFLARAGRKVAVHPGGTADIQRVSMARRIGIGRAKREDAGEVR